MSIDGSPGSDGEIESSADSFWPRFWFNVCKYSEYYFMLLIVLTVFAVLNGMAMLVGRQSTAAFVVSTLVFVMLGITALGVAFVLLQCRRMRVPDSARES